jgi:hypothetical protein
MEIGCKGTKQTITAWAGFQYCGRGKHKNDVLELGLVIALHWHRRVSRTASAAKNMILYIGILFEM